MTKWLLWIGKMMMGTILVSGITLYLTWMTVHTYVDRLLARYHIESPDMQVTDLLGSLTGRITGSQAIAQPGSTSGNEPDSGSTSMSSPSVGPSPNTGLPEGSDRDRVQAMGESGTSGGKVVMSAEEFYRRKEQLTEGDKLAIFTMLMNRLPEKEMQRLTAMVEGGITEEELGVIQSEVEKYLKAEEYKQLMNILNKYR